MVWMVSSKHRTFGLVLLSAAAFGPNRTAALAPPAPTVPTGGEYGPHAWMRELSFDGSKHVSAIRARFASTTSGVPIRYRWEIRPCEASAFVPIEDAEEHQLDPVGLAVRPRRRTWFVDAEGCALRLVVMGTNGGVPAVEHIEIVEGARDVLRAAIADDPALVDGRYETAWSGSPGQGRWTLTLRLPHAERIDRVRMVLGANAVSIARPGLGRNYAVARTAQRWSLATSEDGASYSIVARSTSSLVRRPMVRLATPRPVIALRLTLEGATDDHGQIASGSSPVVHDVAAYTVDEARPVLPEPWVLSVNANPAASARKGTGGELANDAYFAKFLQMRFANWHAGVAADDHFTRRLGPHGELHDADASPSDGRALESIEGDDPALNEAFLTSSFPAPIAVLSGSNDWEYARRTTPDVKGTTRWNPLLSAREGGMGDLADAVKHRAAPFVGFCGGAQILALLEARTDGAGSEIDAVLRRNTGRPIRGFAPEAALIRAWPGEARPTTKVTFDRTDSLFADLAAVSGRSITHAFPQSHLDLVRPEAFLPGGPLARLQIVATSLFCSPAVVASLRAPAIVKNPTGSGRCSRVTEVFRSRGADWPLIGAQFHPEQRDFAVAPAGDPPEAIADARMFVAATYEEIVDAYLRR